MDFEWTWYFHLKVALLFCCIFYMTSLRCQPKGHDVKGAFRSFFWGSFASRRVDFWTKTGCFRLTSLIPTDSWLHLRPWSFGQAARCSRCTKVQGVTSRQESRFAQGWQGNLDDDVELTYQQYINYKFEKEISAWNMEKDHIKIQDGRISLDISSSLSLG